MNMESIYNADMIPLLGLHELLEFPKLNAVDVFFKGIIASELAVWERVVN